MLELIIDYLSEWRTKSEIIDHLYDEYGLGLEERYFRDRYVKQQNKRFYEGESNVFIAHSNKGYKAVKISGRNSDTTDIYKSLEDKEKRALNMFCEISKVKKALGHKINFKLKIKSNGEMVVSK